MVCRRNSADRAVLLPAALYVCGFLRVVPALDVVQQLLECDRAAVAAGDTTGCSWALAYNRRTLTRYNTQTHHFTVEGTALKAEVDALNKDPGILDKVDSAIQQGITLTQQLLEAAKPILDQTVPPSVRIQSEGQSWNGLAQQLRCSVTGFSPRAVNVSWLRDGEDMGPVVLHLPILPNSQGTFQTAAYITVEPEPPATYTCLVQHASYPYPEGYRLDWVGGHHFSLSPAAILGILFGIVGAIFVMVAVYLHLKSQGRHAGIFEPTVLFLKNRRQGRSNQPETSVRSNASATSGDGLTQHPA
ncbi:class II histocompatibility antigen, B-L beta chain-like isoform X2 [Hemiscyllium ocellatum]|uniref:class II histocompatibility antigen, B-L beta chain-like isoform X2 n=1 Tax=Hemiscyllium ocellatum TaxID=170820 RepID=UPI0029673025|nr:class II histocompatibility antigen, B-L beta chain-like isoform X2 [Hemiscyllium ocellatum]